MAPQIHEFSESGEWIRASVEEITRDIPKNTAFSLALSGGSTPEPVYEALAESSLPWNLAEIFQTDERYVHPEKPESNAWLIREHFLSLLPDPEIKTHFFLSSPDLIWEDSAKVYDTLMKSRSVPFDVAILGMGPDGHIASLFPNGPELRENEKCAVTSETNQFPVWKRLTLTFPVILKSKKIVLLLKGKEKEPALEELLHGTKSWEEWPAKRLLGHANLHVFYWRG